MLTITFTIEENKNGDVIVNRDVTGVGVRNELHMVDELCRAFSKVADEAGAEK